MKLSTIRLIIIVFVIACCAGEIYAQGDGGGKKQTKKEVVVKSKKDKTKVKEVVKEQPKSNSESCIIVNLREAKRLWESLGDTSLPIINKAENPSEFKARELKLEKTKESIILYLTKASDCAKNDFEKMYIEAFLKDISGIRFDIDAHMGRPTKECIELIEIVTKYFDECIIIIEELQ